MQLHQRDGSAAPCTLSLRSFFHQKISMIKMEKSCIENKYNLPPAPASGGQIYSRLTPTNLPAKFVSPLH